MTLESNGININSQELPKCPYSRSRTNLVLRVGETKSERGNVWFPQVVRRDDYTGMFHLNTRSADEGLGFFRFLYVVLPEQAAYLLSFSHAGIGENNM